MKADGRGTLRRRKRALRWTEPVWREISCGAGENGGGNYRMLFSGDEGGKGVIKRVGLDFLSEKIRSGLKTVPFLKKKCAIIGQMAERKCFYGYG